MTISNHRGTDWGPLAGPRSYWLLVALVAALACTGLAAVDAFARADLLLQGFLSRDAAPSARPPITIVAIDEPALAAAGQFPWERAVYTRLVERLAAAQPAVVAFDVGFFDRTEEDAAPLGRALADAPFPVVLAAKAVALQEPDAATGFLRASTLQLPLAELLVGERVTPGFANVLVERDQTVRRVPVAVSGPDGATVPSLSVAVVRALFDVDPVRDPLRLEGSDAFLTARTYRRLEQGEPLLTELRPGAVPLDGFGAFLVHYAGGQGTFPTISAAAVLDGTADPALLAGRVVLIGATAPDLHDMVARPGVGAAQIAGVEAHAHALMTLLSGDVIAPMRLRDTVVLVFLFALLAAAAARFLSTGRGLLAALVLALLVPLVAAVAFSLASFGDRAGRLVSLAYPLGAVAASYVGVLLARITTEEREKRYLRRAFTQYVSPEVVRAIVADPSSLKLGGARRELTVLFSDLRGFTTLSERLTPEELVALLNEYFDVQTGIVLAEHGVIDKFIGDALMAFWGAPLDEPAHAVRACAGALAMTRSIAPFNISLARRSLAPIAMGVGLATGPAVVGNMGSSRRFDYTAMGDTVNLASRLEGLTKHYGVPVLVSAATRAAAEHAFIFRTVDRVRVKGKSEAVEVSEILATVDEGAPDWLVGYEAALRDYWARDAERAVRGFEAVLAAIPGDGPAQTHLARIAGWKDAPPPEGWDGATSFETK